jgi:hypothetical protein
MVPRREDKKIMCIVIFVAKEPDVSSQSTSIVVRNLIDVKCFGQKASNRLRPIIKGIRCDNIHAVLLQRMGVHKEVVSGHEGRNEVFQGYVFEAVLCGIAKSLSQNSVTRS